MSTHSVTVPAVSTKQGRAKPLSRDDRRQAILTAVIPLLIEKGSTATTAEMADAAGIAEGTIFRAFPNKAALIHEAVKATMDPRPIEQALAGIPDFSPIEIQLAEAARILAERFDRITALIGILRSMPHSAERPPADARRIAADSMTAISAALAVLFERHRDRLLIEPSRAAAAFRGLVFTNSHPLIAFEEKLSIDEIVTVLLSGVVAPAAKAN